MVSRAIVESECVIPAIPVSDIAGAMADVSAAGVAARFWQPAMRSAALKARIVFIVTPSHVIGGERTEWQAVTVAGQRREAKLLSCRLLSSRAERRGSIDLPGSLSAASTATRIEVESE